MIDFETAKNHALEYIRKEKNSKCLVCGGSELTDSWVFNFAWPDKTYLTGVVLRVYKNDGQYERVSPLDDDKYSNEYKEKKIG